MKLGRLMRHTVLSLTSRSSSDYWERRYRSGMTSGSGSYGVLADFKAQILNDFVRRHGVGSVIEFGCGDGHQLELAHYPRYLGLDVSKTAIDICRERFKGDATKSFLWYDPARAVNLSGFMAADLTLSLDVIYHLIEDDVYETYLRQLFSTARRFVAIYSSDQDGGPTLPHVRHRQVSADVRQRFPEFDLIERVGNRYPDQSFASFFLYARSGISSIA